MTFEEFVNEVKSNIRDWLPEAYKDAELEFVDTMKLNEVYPALIVRTDDEEIAPSINLRAVYEDYLENENLEMTMAFLTEIIQKKPEGLSVEKFNDYEKAKKNFFIRVGSAEKNRDFLETVPHTLVENLAITYHILVVVNEHEMGSTAITNTLLDAYGVTKEQLHKDAVENSMRVLEPKVTPMVDVIGEMMGIDGGSHDEETFDEMLTKLDGASADMIVLSNTQSVNGAAVIFYPEVLDKIGQQLEGDYFILPSSVHEVILVPDRGQFKYQELESMVREINENELKPSDVLSNTVYHYDSSEKKFELAKDFVERADREENGKEEKAKHKKEKEYER